MTRNPPVTLALAPTLHPLGCVACGSDHVTSTGTQPQTHRCHDCALVWLNTDTIRVLHARVALRHQPQLLPPRTRPCPRHQREHRMTDLPPGTESRVQWGVRLTWNDDPDAEPLDYWRETRTEADRTMAAHHGHIARDPGWRVRPALIRRYIHTTPAEVFDEAQPETPPVVATGEHQEQP